MVASSTIVTSGEAIVAPCLPARNERCSSTCVPLKAPNSPCRKLPAASVSKMTGILADGIAVAPSRATARVAAFRPTRSGVSRSAKIRFRSEKVPVRFWSPTDATAVTESQHALDR